MSTEKTRTVPEIGHYALIVDSRTAALIGKNTRSTWPALSVGVAEAEALSHAAAMGSPPCYRCSSMIMENNI